MIPAERIDMLPKQGGGLAEDVIIDRMTFCPELCDHGPNMQRIPGHHGIMKHR
jgi:hypothetical protein